MSTPPAAACCRALAGATALTAFPRYAFAADPVKIGLILPMTGPFASTGKQISAACKLYMEKNGDTVAGRKVELIVKDDTGLAPETTKRIAQEMVVQDKITILAGFGLTPLALAAAPVATEAKIADDRDGRGTGSDPDSARRSSCAPGSRCRRSPRRSPQWASKNRIKRVFTLVTDYGPGLDAEKTFHAVFTDEGRRDRRVGAHAAAQPRLRAVPAAREGREADALFVFVPSGEGLAVMKQFDERGLKQAGIQLIGTGDVTDDDLLESMGAPAVGVITSFHYSAAHESPENKAYVDGDDEGEQRACGPTSTRSAATTACT